MIKSASIYIGKTLKAAIVSTAAVAFLTSGLLFCCMMMPSHAKAASQTPSCHAQKAAKHQESKTCDCCKIAKNDSDQAGKVFELVQTMGKSFKIAFVADYLLNNLAYVVSTHLACQGPPRAKSSLPIYLQFSSLRL